MADARTDDRSTRTTPVSRIKRRRRPIAGSWVHYEVRHSKRPKNYLDIVYTRLAGEAIGMEVDHPGTYKAIRCMTQKSKAIMVLFDSVRVRDAGREEDVFASNWRRTFKNLHATPKKGRREKPPRLAIIFTKSDWCPEAKQDPARFAGEHMPGLMQFCKQSLQDHGFFASSVVGSSASMIDRYGCMEQVRFTLSPMASWNRWNGSCKVGGANVRPASCIYVSPIAAWTRVSTWWGNRPVCLIRWRNGSITGVLLTTR